MTCALSRLRRISRCSRVLSPMRARSSLLIEASISLISATWRARRAASRPSVGPLPSARSSGVASPSARRRGRPVASLEGRCGGDVGLGHGHLISRAQAPRRRAFALRIGRVGGRDEWYRPGMTDAGGTISVKLFAGLELRCARASHLVRVRPTGDRHGGGGDRGHRPRPGRRRPRPRQRRSCLCRTRSSDPATRSRSSRRWGAGEPRRAGRSRPVRRGGAPGAGGPSGARDPGPGGASGAGRVGAPLRPPVLPGRRASRARHRFAYAIIGLLVAASLRLRRPHRRPLAGTRTRYHYWFLLLEPRAGVGAVRLRGHRLQPRLRRAAPSSTCSSWRRAILWLAFFPDAPYILTDFLHLGSMGDLVPGWFDVLMLVLVRLDRAHARHRLPVPDAGDRRPRLGNGGRLGLRGGRRRPRELRHLPGPVPALEQLGHRAGGRDRWPTSCSAGVTDPASQPKLLGFTLLFTLLFLFIYVAVYIFAKLTKPPGGRVRA